MAQGIELWLGFQWDPKTGFEPALSELKKLGLEYEHEGDEDLVGDITHNGNISDILLRAWQDTLTDSNMTILGPGRSPFIGDYKVETPAGIRTMGPFRIERHFDPGEMGELPEDAILGVAITSRYYPTYADYKSECGAWNGRPIPFDLMKIAKRNIVKHLPFFKEAKWHVLETHY